MKNNTTYLGILCLLMSAPLLAQDAFITTWVTNAPSATSTTTVTIPANGTGYNYDVDWENDGVYDDFGITTAITHDYGVEGTYTVAIKGAFPKIDMSSSTDRVKLKSIDQWGTQQWVSMAQSFAGCRNLIITATDSPDLSLVTDMSYMFSNATSLNQDISFWDVSNITDMSYMFSNAQSFDQPIGEWNVGQVTNMSGMFMTAIGFNQNLDNWDVSNVTNMSNMFDYALVFNQAIGSWDVSKVVNMHRMFYQCPLFNQPIGGWNVSNVTNMHEMFRGSTAFNQPIGAWDVSNIPSMMLMFYQARAFNQDIGNWDVSNVINMQRMFAEAENFNQDLGSWDVNNVSDMARMFDYATNFNQDLGNWNVSNVVNMFRMFDGVTLSTNNYDSLLANWSLLPLKSNVNLNGGSSTYCNSANARQSIIDNFGWTITDAGLDCSNLSVSDFDNSNISVFPNPITSSFTINGIEKNSFNIQVSNLQGQIVKEIMHYNLEPVSIKSLANGVYFVKLDSYKASKTIRVVKAD